MTEENGPKMDTVRKLLFPIVVLALLACLGTIFGLFSSSNSAEHTLIREDVKKNSNEVRNVGIKIELEVEKVKTDIKTNQNMLKKEMNEQQKIQMSLLLEIKEDIGEIKGQLRGTP